MKITKQEFLIMIFFNSTEIGVMNKWNEGCFQLLTDYILPFICFYITDSHPAASEKIQLLKYPSAYHESQ